MKTSSLMIAWSTGIAIFSMFFGSGNVVFPLLLGQVTGDQIGYALAGLMITAVGAPLLGLLGCVLFSGDCKQFFYRLGVVPGYFVVILIMAILGPFGVLPRCFIVAYGAFTPYFPQVSLLMFSLLAGVITLALIAKRQLILPILGLVLSPALIVILIAIIALAIYNSSGLPVSSLSPLMAFKEGLLVGYDTMDLLAAIFFAVSIWLLLKEKLQIQDDNAEKRNILSIYWKASLIGGVFLGLIYVGLSLSAALHPQALLDSAPEQVLPNLSVHLLGPHFALLANIAIFLACLTTVMSLTVAIGDVIHVEVENSSLEQYIPYRYEWMIVALIAITVVFSNFGFMGIMHFLHPIVAICYPAIIVLTICNILYKLYGFTWVKAPVYATLLITLFFKIVPTAHAGMPTLLDVRVEGSQDAPILIPADLQLDVGQEYLLVVDNQQEFGISIHYDKLGQNVFSHYLQGASGVAHDGFTVNGKAKVLWHFQVTNGGEFTYFASNPSLNRQGRAGKITIPMPKDEKKAEEPQADQDKVSAETVAKEDKKEVNDDKKGNQSSRSLLTRK